MTTEKKLAAYLGETAPTLVEFYRPGKEEDPAVINQVRDRMGGKANVMRIDGTENPDLMKEYKVDTYPTFIIFKDGQEAWRDSGVKGAGELHHLLSDFV